MPEKRIELPALQRVAEIRSSSFNTDENTVDIVFTTGATVRRWSWSEGAYDEELVVEPGSVRLERLNLGAPFLNTHSDYDLGDVIGSVVPGSARIEKGRGVCTVLLSRRADVAGIVQDIRDGVIRNISAGYRYHKIEKTDGQDGDPAHWRVVDWEPLEISAVPIPADPGAQVRSDPERDRAPRHPCVLVETRSDPEPAPSTETSPEPATPAADAGADAMSKSAAETETADRSTEQETINVPTNAPAATPAPDAAAIRAEAVEAERARVSTISELAEKVGMRKLGADAIKRGVSIDKFREELLDAIAKREDKTVIQSNAEADQTAERQPQDSRAEKRAEAITAALMHRADPAVFKVTDDAREFRGLTLLDFARDSLEGNGVSTRGMSKMEIADKALRIGGLQTTSDFPAILANVANKTLRAGYEAAPQTFRPFTREVTLPDFKETSRVQLGEAPQLEKVNEHGEFKRGSIAEGKESYSLLTYGKVVGITRQVIINDDLNAFTRIPRMFGVQAANLESDLVWAQIIGNPVMGDGVALFHATHNNLGTAAGISADSIALAFEAMRLQKGMDGKTFLNLTPKFLITPVAAVMKAMQLLTSATPAMVATQGSAIVPEYLRTLVPISEPRLDGGFINPATGATVAGSRFNWFLAADPAMNDTVEIAYLEGNRGVYTETRQGFDIDGVEVKVRLDVGAKVIDWRSFYKNPASAL